MDLLHQRLQMAIRAGVGDMYGLISILSTLSHFVPPQVVVIRELSLSWMTDILGSRYEARDRCIVAGEVVELFWEQIKHLLLLHSSSDYTANAASIPPLLDFLRLGEQTHWPEIVPGVLALQILSHGERTNNFGPTILPILASTLQPTHPLQSRKTALKAFYQFGFGWFSSQMEGVSGSDRAGLLRAVGDPFQSTPDSILQGNQLAKGKYNPMNVAATLIELASSDLWRSHLRRSNFASCEEVISTPEGMESVFQYLKDATTPRPFLSTPARIISAIERLESLRCPRTVEVVLTFIWVSRGVDEPPIDLDGWRLIQQKTLMFYQTHGMGRLKILSQHITAIRSCYLYYRGPRCRVEGIRLPVRITMYRGGWVCGEDTAADFRLGQVCQRKMLYQLFGCSPGTWEEMVAADSERVDEGVGVSVGQPGVSAPFVDWACDYP